MTARTRTPDLAPRVVFLVPRRADNGPRDQAWAYARARLERYWPDWAIVEGHHTDGPFNRSAAINRAAAAAGDWDVGIVIDSDVLFGVAQVQAAVAGALEGRVTWAHRRWRGLREDATARLVADLRDWGPELSRDELDLLVERTNPLSWSCCIAIPRATFDDMGGFDERFRGWGFEDMAFQSLVVGLYPWGRVEADVVHLWHPRSDERITPGAGRATSSPEYVTNARLGRRYMVALRRDHGGHDRVGGPAAPDELARDLANLRADDAKWNQLAMRMGMPDWADYWPTLEQLRDDAKAARLPARATVTLVVHTDGRREYIAQAIPSLLEQVQGPISKRVIYDDSGDPEYKAWLAEQFPDFVVVGPAGRLGYTGSMRAMWAYLQRRCSSEYVFLAEDDFTYDREVQLEPMIEVLADNPHLRQLALLRHAYYPREIEAGGIIAEHPEAYQLVGSNGTSRLEHRLYFTANPSLFRRSLTATAWPNAPSSERVYADVLNRDPASRFAYWGTGDEWVTHIGAERSAAGLALPR